jgi:hypothetical protein
MDDKLANSIAKRVLAGQNGSAAAGSRGPTPQQRFAMRILQKLVRLNAESLVLYHGLPLAEKVHACLAQWLVLDGSTRSAKTLTAAIEEARALCGCDPYKKYPAKNGRSLCIGLSGDHLAETMFPKVFKAGAFWTIPDEHTGVVRSVRPDANNPMVLDPYDLAYRERWVEAPPLVPHRMIKGGWRGIAFENRKTEEPRMVPMVTGWRSLWRPAGAAARPPQGDTYNKGWIDEHIENEGFYREMCRGFVDRNGRGIWSACPQHANLELIGLRDRALAEDPQVKRFTFLIADNPFYTPEDKGAYLKNLGTDEIRRVMYYGEYAAVGRRVYAHLFERDGPQTCDPFQPPQKHCLYVGVDPGRQYGATVLGWVDPDEQHLYVSDAWVLNHLDAKPWAADLKRRLEGRRPEAIVFDQQMGKQHAPGPEWNSAQFYWAALQDQDFLPKRQGPLYGFFPGSNDVSAREEALLGMMRIREHGPFAGTCRLQIMRGRCSDLEDQIILAQYDTKTGQKRMKFAGRDDLVSALEYLAAHNPVYHGPSGIEEQKSTPRQLAAANRLKQLRRGRSPVGRELK